MGQPASPDLKENIFALRIQICPKKGISPIILLWGWDCDHQSYSSANWMFPLNQLQGHGLFANGLSAFSPDVWAIFAGIFFWGHVGL